MSLNTARSRGMSQNGRLRAPSWVSNLHGTADSGPEARRQPFGRGFIPALHRGQCNRQGSVTVCQPSTPSAMSALCAHRTLVSRVCVTALTALCIGADTPGTPQRPGLPQVLMHRRSRAGHIPSRKGGTRSCALRPDSGCLQAAAALQQVAAVQHPHCIGGDSLRVSEAGRLTV